MPAVDSHPQVRYNNVIERRCSLGLPSQSPFGILPGCERLFEGPTRIRGVRDYQPGDSLRRMDWKTSARVGSLQVRRFEPVIALETAVFLNLDSADYTAAERLVATELAIVIAASISVHLVEKRQAISLVTNGRDPLREPDLEASAPASVPALPLFFLGRLPPREMVRYFYLSVARRAAQAGQPRRSAQTPYEYQHSLDQQFPELEPDLEGLTGAFIQARYAARPVGKEDVVAVKPLWQRVKSALRRRRT